MNTEAKGKTREREKEPAYINFIESDDLDEQVIFAGGRKKTLKLEENDHLLDDTHFSPNQLHQLFLKPRFMVIYCILLMYSCYKN